MKCEICGEEVKHPRVISVEGSVLRVCEKCAKYGVLLRVGSPRHTRKYKAREQETLEVVDDYSKLVHDKREALGLTQEELGRRINEPESVISRLETGKMVPSEGISRKLEKALGLSLLTKPSGGDVKLPVRPKEEPTLGDLALLKKRKKH
ncbi:MAG: TIGR00270 family protein [Candidatus Diapherotrites archaeon]|nr:TIGR00270 family protein [Candidatus Diapherotrites archaeon]